MQLIVPDLGAYETVRDWLSGDRLTEMATGGTFEQVDLTLPKFEIKSVVPAAQTLQSMGIVTGAFNETEASFPAFASLVYDNVYVSDVLHQATVSIDEKGTEASAATAIVVAGIVSSIDVPRPTPRSSSPITRSYS